MEFLAPDGLIVGGGVRIRIPAGNTSQRPSSPAYGDFRYNTDSNIYEAYGSSGWGPLATVALGNDIQLANTITVGNSTVNSFINSTTSTIGGITQNSTGIYLNLTTVSNGNISIGSNTIINTSGFGLGNTTVNVIGNSSGLAFSSQGVANSLGINWGNATNYSSLTNAQIQSVNSTSNVVINPLGVTVAGATSINSSAFSISGIWTVNATAITYGNSTVFSTLNATALVIQSVNATALVANTLSLVSAISVGNSTVNTQINSSSMTINGDTVLSANLTATIKVGYTLAPKALGNIGSTFTPNAALGNFQYGNNHVASTWNTPSSDCSITILVTNDGSAGTITFSGYAGGSTGDSLDTTSGHQFLINITRINSVSMYSVRALQ